LLLLRLLPSSVSRSPSVSISISMSGELPGGRSALVKRLARNVATESRGGPLNLTRDLPRVLMELIPHRPPTAKENLGKIIVFHNLNGCSFDR
jgi:hypothetical protein